MAREIKFRAWDKGVSQMFDWKIVSWQFPQLMANENIEVMQYTGIKDKNSKEIYEGDFLKWNNHILEVRWGSVGWTLWSDLFKSFGHSKGDDCGEYHTKSYCFSSEIIGNVYENKDLL